MNGGINQLVDTYKGNPQPLANQVRKAQQGQPPGEIPADLEEALALQEIAKLRQGAQNQQAMQAGGAQPSVVDKLKQILAGNQAQAQMAQGQPVMAARGGSIDQLMSNLGRHYAGGGIIAFDGTNGSKVEDEAEETKKKLQQYTLQQQGADWVARKQAARLAEAEGQSKESLPQFIQDIAKFPEMFDAWKQRAREQDAINAAADRRMAQYKQDKLAAQQKTSLANYLVGSPEREKEGLEKLAELSNAPLPKTSVGDLPAPTKASGSATATAAAPLDAETQKLLNLAASRAQTGVSTNPDLVPRKPIVGTSPDDAKPRPSAGGAGAGSGAGGSGAAPQNVDPDSLDAITRKYLKGEFAVNPETERDKAVNWARQTMGLDSLLSEKERRANAREAAIRNIEAKRTPAWVEGLANARKSVRGGLGSLIGQMGDTADTVRQGYEMQSLAFQKELDQLRDVIIDAKISGNKELVKEGMAAYKEVDARRRAAAQSSASLLNTDATNAMRLQTAREGAANRAQIAAAQAEGKKSERQQRQQNWIAEQERKWQETLSKNSAYKDAVTQRSMYERMLNMSTNPATQEKAQAGIDLQNEKIAKLLPTTVTGTANIPPPPQGAVREIKKS